jgi:hypothetical protein
MAADAFLSAPSPSMETTIPTCLMAAEISAARRRPFNVYVSSTYEQGKRELSRISGWARSIVVCFRA